MGNHDDVVLFSPLDQSVDTDNDWALHRVDEIIAESIEKKDAFIALNLCRQLYGVSKVSGLSLAKALYFTNINWTVYEVGDEFENVIQEYTGLHPHTVDRYIHIWKMFEDEDVPLHLVHDLQQRSTQELAPVALTIKQGYEIEDEQWEEIAEATNRAEIATILREDVKHKPPRKSLLQIYMDRDGSLWAFKDNQRKFVGSLEINDDAEIVQKAVNRILTASGVIRQ